MKTTFMNYLIIGLITVTSIIFLLFFISFIASTIIALIIGIVTYLIIKKFTDEKDSVNSSTDSEKTPQSADEIGIESLLNANILLRKSIIPIKLRDSFEQVIDQLLNLLPKVNELDADGELAWVINRMATVYLPNKSIQPYLALNEDSRKDESTIASVEEALAGMKSELLEVEQILATRRTNEFNTKAKFLKQRFND